MKLTQAPYPKMRFRRLRSKAAIRDLVSETRLSPSDLIWPIFIQAGENLETPIQAMPGVSRLSIDRAVLAAKRARDLSIPAICLFPYTDPAKRTPDCAEAWNRDNLINRAISEIKASCPDIAIMTDVALDPYNSLGHDGIVRSGEILNDETIEALVKMAMSQAESGADILGPSDMMDGRIGAIRAGLEENGFKNVALLSYAAKYASVFYGPFREAVGTAAALHGDKRSYQMDPANTEEALRIVSRDLHEGADMVMIKPGLAYLDICQRVSQEFCVPTFAYQVSGEYMMIKLAAQNGWIDENGAVFESLLAFKRAGCAGILTYFAPDIATALLSR